MQQQDQESRECEGSEQESKESTGSQEGSGSQASTTGYGTGQAIGDVPLADRSGQGTPSNSGDAGGRPGEGGVVSEDRTEQMAHADGSSAEHDPDV